MDANEQSRRAKITVRIWRPTWEALTSRADAALLRRDALITQALKVELPRIRRELPGRNSDDIRRQIEAQLRLLFASKPGAVQVSIALNVTTAKLLDEVCDEKNMPRDSLLNRLVLLLGEPIERLDELFFMTPHPWSVAVDPLWLERSPEELRALEADVASTEEDSKSTFDDLFSPIGRVRGIVEDPLLRYRRMLDALYAQLQTQMLHNREGRKALEADRYCYTPFGMPLDDEELEGLNCYLSDVALQPRQQQERHQITSSKPRRQGVAKRPAVKPSAKK